MRELNRTADTASINYHELFSDTLNSYSISDITCDEYHQERKNKYRFQLKCHDAISYEACIVCRNEWLVEKYDLPITFTDNKIIVNKVTEFISEICDCEGGQQHLLSQYYENHDILGIAIHGWEGYHHELIKLNSNQKVFTTSSPLFSPDGYKFLCCAYDDASGMIGNAFQVFEHNNDSMKLKISGSNWDKCGPKHLYWKNDSTIYIMLAQYFTGPGLTEVPRYLSCNLK